MKKCVLLLILIFCIPFMVKAEEVKIDWVKAYNNEDDLILQDAIYLSDENYVVVANNGYFNDDDSYIIKYDKSGNVLWKNRWKKNRNDVFKSVVNTDDNGFVVVGYSNSTDIEGVQNKGYDDGIIIKFNQKGEVEWEKTWGGSSIDYLSSIIYTQNNDFIVVGYTDSTDIEGLTNKGDRDAIIIKYNSEGEILWQTSWGGDKYDVFNDIMYTNDGGFIVCGNATSKNIEGLPIENKDAIIIKYNKNGEVEWQKNWGGNEGDDFSSVIVTNDGYVVVGSSTSTDIEGIVNKGGKDGIIAKYNHIGELSWHNSFGGNFVDQFVDIVEMSDGNYIVSGWFESIDIENFPNASVNSEIVFPDALLIKYDKNGNEIWKQGWCGENTCDDVSEESYDVIMKSKDNDIIVMGVAQATNIEGIEENEYFNILMIKYTFDYELEKLDNDNGEYSIDQKANVITIEPTPNEGYEVDKIIIKDKEGNVLDVEVMKLENGTYSFELYTDISVEVLFKEKIENPKTGVQCIVGTLITMIVMFISAYFVIEKFDGKCEI